MITSCYQNVVNFTYLMSKEGKNNKRYVKNIFWKVFENSTKLITSSSLVMLWTFFTQRTLKEKLGTQRALQGHLATRALMTLAHLGIRALETLQDSKGTWALGHSRHLDTEALRQSGTQTALRHSKHSVYSVITSTSFFVRLLVD